MTVKEIGNKIYKIDMICNETYFADTFRECMDNSLSDVDIKVEKRDTVQGKHCTLYTATSPNKSTLRLCFENTTNGDYLINGKRYNSLGGNFYEITDVSPAETTCLLKGFYQTLRDCAFDSHGTVIMIDDLELPTCIINGEEHKTEVGIMDVDMNKFYSSLSGNEISEFSSDDDSYMVKYKNNIVSWVKERKENDDIFMKGLQTLKDKNASSNMQFIFVGKYISYLKENDQISFEEYVELLRQCASFSNNFEGDEQLSNIYKFIR